MTTILWLIRGSTHLSKAYSDFASQLEKLGHSITFLNVTEDIPTYDWLNNQISQSHKWLFFSEPDLQWVKKINEAMTLLPVNPARVHVWVYDSISSEQLAYLEGSGIDEVVSAQESVKELPLKLELREKRNTARTELKRQVRELLMKEARAETIVSQREEFLSVCAHDLRSPLGIIQSSLSLLLSEPGGLDTNHKEFIERSKRQAEHGLRLVNDLLDVMAYEQGLKPDYQLIDLDLFLKNIYRDYSFQAKQKNIEMRYDNSLLNWRVLIDPDRIQQLLQNLIVNAIKFTENEKKIYLNVLSFKGRRKVDPPYPMVIVSVRDEGRGIPESEIQKIFNRFSQIKDYSRVEGRGLGLSVAKQISHLHDGNLWVKSIEGEGSTFFVLFPHVLSEPKKQEKSSGERKLSKILIADSDKDHQAQIASIVNRWGFESVLARDGIELVTLAFYHQPQIILIGSEMNKLNEEAAAKIVKNDLGYKYLPIFSCVSSNSLLVHNREQSNLDGVLKLPLDRTQFERALDQFCEKNKLSRKKVA